MNTYEIFYDDKKGNTHVVLHHTDETDADRIVDKFEQTYKCIVLEVKKSS